MKQKGFSLVEGIILGVVVVLIGVGGWYVYQANIPKNKLPDSTNVTTTPPPSQNAQTGEIPPPASTKLTTQLTSHRSAFKINLPDGWIVTNDTEQDYAHAHGLANMTYKAGTPAQIVSEFGHRGGGINTASFSMELRVASEVSGSGTETNITTASGLEGKRYLTVINQNENNIPDGSKSYYYIFKKGDRAVTVSYLQLPTDPDQLHIVDDTVKTLVIL